MTSTLNRSPLPLRDVLYEFSLAKERPDADLLALVGEWLNIPASFLKLNAIPSSE